MKRNTRRTYLPLYTVRTALTRTDPETGGGRYYDGRQGRIYERANRTIHVRPRRRAVGYTVDARYITGGELALAERRVLKRGQAIRLAQQRAAATPRRQAAPIPDQRRARRWGGGASVLGVTASQRWDVVAYQNGTFVLGAVHWHGDALDSRAKATVEQWVYRSRRSSTRAYQHAERGMPIPAAAGYNRTGPDDD